MKIIWHIADRQDGTLHAYQEHLISNDYNWSLNHNEFMEACIIFADIISISIIIMTDISITSITHSTWSVTQAFMMMQLVQMHVTTYVIRYCPNHYLYHWDHQTNHVTWWYYDSGIRKYWFLVHNVLQSMQGQSKHKFVWIAFDYKSCDNIIFRCFSFVPIHYSDQHLFVINH